MNPEIIAAIEELNLIEMVYENQWMVVQPYCYGTTAADSELLIAFLVEAQSPDILQTWSLFELEKANEFNILKETFYPEQQLPQHLTEKLYDIYIQL